MTRACAEGAGFGPVWCCPQGMHCAGGVRAMPMATPLTCTNGARRWCKRCCGAAAQEMLVCVLPNMMSIDSAPHNVYEGNNDAAME